MNKPLQITSFFAFFFLFYAIQGSSQVIPIVEFKQGKIIGSLPYMEHFYIQGSALLPKDTAEKVVVEIYNVGKYKKSELPASLAEERIKEIIDDRANLVNRSEWYSFRSLAKSQFKVYINTLLPFKRKYLIVVSYFKKFQFSLGPAERTRIMDRVVELCTNRFNREQFLDLEFVEQTLQDVTYDLLFQKVNAQDYELFTSDQIRDNVPLIPTNLINQLREDIGDAATQAVIVEEIEEELRTAKIRLEGMSGEDAVAMASDIASLESEVNKRKADAAKIQERLEKSIEVIKSKMIIVGQEYFSSATNSVSVTNVKSIGTGTSFGGGLVSLNPFNSNNEMESLGYSGVKFFLSPVDKRVVNPYLDRSFFLNRLAIMVGASTTGDLQYRGQQLESVLNFNPLLGFSYDVTRSLSVDLGGTLFRQPAVSPLQNNSEIRIGPILGATFDIDGFNRIRALTNSEPYKVDPVKLSGNN